MRKVTTINASYLLIWYHTLSNSKIIPNIATCTFTLRVRCSTKGISNWTDSIYYNVTLVAFFTSIYGGWCFTIRITYWRLGERNKTLSILEGEWWVTRCTSSCIHIIVVTIIGNSSTKSTRSEVISWFTTRARSISIKNFTKRILMIQVWLGS